MTTRLVKREQSERRETREVRFGCKYCRETKHLDDMRTLIRFFPPVVACQDCAKKIQ